MANLTQAQRALLERVCDPTDADIEGFKRWTSEKGREAPKPRRRKMEFVEPDGGRGRPYNPYQ